MFDAGRKSLCEFSSKRTRPESSDTTLIPTIAGASSGRRKTSEMLVCKACNVRVVVATRGAGVGDAVGTGSGVGVGLGLGTIAGVGVGVGIGAGLVTTFRSRCGVNSPGQLPELADKRLPQAEIDLTRLRSDSESLVLNLLLEVNA